MTFNWFNRRYDDKSKTSEVEQAKDTPSTEPKSAAPEAPTEAAAAAISEDYLAWAKAAYKNIQQRQQVETLPPEPVAAEAVSPEAEPVASEPSEAVVAGAETTPESEAATVTPELAAATEIPVAIATSQAGEPEAEVADVEVAESVEPDPVLVADEHAPVAMDSDDATPTKTAPLPFWAQAEADRQLRLERLKATAIAEVQPEPEPSAQPTSVAAPTAPAMPDLELDEGFLWSAEVLAAQGRRPDQVSLEEITWLNRLRQGLDKTRRGLINQLRSIVGQGPLNQDAVIEIESALLQADVGVEATDFIIEALQSKLKQDVLPPDAAITYLKEILREMLDRPLGDAYSYTFAPEKDSLNIWLITGVNGAGKTTTIGKLSHIAQKSGYRCLIAAADTFRAAAVEQVKVWGQRSGVEVIANPGQNTDPAAVVFDAISAAQSRNTELLLVDTAGRLQNKKNLMDELSKIRRIIDKKAGDVKIESLLVLDATLGQNGLRQAEVFAEAAQLSGVVLTKLDGTAKGGIALAIVQQLGLPIRFIGAGEGIEDLRPFSSYEFVEALLNG
ncbi:MAG: signal recognition particle-docking protein FtsY [Scytolyngbya sp. HA4215-MV1]|jgi:fused signal recognition particle receptor|nr:signal recognition particle-docking protein FtsY [Scytolyngbya sp. HA4215-MV1]